MVTDNLTSLREKEKINHDKQATDLPKINEGSDVWYHNHNKDIWGKGMVVEWDQNHRSYTLVNYCGKMVIHNCIDLKKCFNKVGHKDYGKIPKPPTKAVKPKSSVTHKSHMKPSQYDVVITQYSRVVKPPKERICKSPILRCF